MIRDYSSKFFQQKFSEWMVHWGSYFEEMIHSCSYEFYESINLLLEDEQKMYGIYIYLYI